MKVSQSERWRTWRSVNCPIEQRAPIMFVPPNSSGHAALGALIRNDRAAACHERE